MLVTWSPWTELSRLEQAVNHMLDNGRAAKPEGVRTEAGVPTWTPPVDVLEEQGRIVLVADLPGVAENDIEISVDKNVLTVKGSRQPQTQIDGEPRQRRLERASGVFSRAFALPPTVDVEKIAAELKNGVLTLSLAKKAEAQPRQIKIGISAS